MHFQGLSNTTITFTYFNIQFYPFKTLVWKVEWDAGKSKNLSSVVAVNKAWPLSDRGNISRCTLDLSIDEIYPPGRDCLALITLSSRPEQVAQRLQKFTGMTIMSNCGEAWAESANRVNELNKEATYRAPRRELTEPGFLKAIYKVFFWTAGCTFAHGFLFGKAQHINLVVI